MSWITCDEYKIMVQVHNGSQEIINNTGYLPLCLYNGVILMANGKLYIIRKYELLELALGTKNDYVINDINFTDEYVKINSENYEIIWSEPTLHKIPIVAKNNRDIIKFYNIHDYYYYYIDIDGDLIFCCEKNRLYTILDNNVEMIFFRFGSDIKLDHIIYKQNGDIICSEHDSSKIITTYTINYDKLTIVKASGFFVLDSDNVMHKFIFVGKKYFMIKVLGDVIDFNVCNTKLYIIDSTHNIYDVNIYNYSRTHIGNNGFFKKNVITAKSANKLYQV